MEKKKEVRCLDCDYVLIDKDGKETNVLLTLEGNGTKYGLCKKCGSFVFVEGDGKKIYVDDNINTLTYILLASVISKLLDEQGIDLDETIKEYNEKEKEEEEIFLKNNNSIKTYKDIFNSATRPVDKSVKAVRKYEEPSEAFSNFIKSITIPAEASVTLNNEPLRKIPDFDEDCILNYRYILLSKGHDSWKIFESKEELLKELNSINSFQDVLIYTLGKECKVKREVSLV